MLNSLRNSRLLVSRMLVMSKWLTVLLLRPRLNGRLGGSSARVVVLVMRLDDQVDALLMFSRHKNGFLF